MTSHTGVWQQPGDLDLSDFILSAFLPVCLPSTCPHSAQGSLAWCFYREGERLGGPLAFPTDILCFCFFLLQRGGSRYTETWSLEELREVWFFSLPLPLGFLGESVWDGPQRTPWSPACQVARLTRTGEGLAVGEASKAATTPGRERGLILRGDNPPKTHEKVWFSGHLILPGRAQAAVLQLGSTLQGEAGAVGGRAGHIWHLLKTRQTGQKMIWKCWLLSCSGQPSGRSSPLALLPESKASGCKLGERKAHVYMPLSPQYLTGRGSSLNSKLAGLT